MRIAAFIVLAAMAAAPAAKAASVEETFRAFGLFGTWATDCAAPAAPDNPHVHITAPTPGLVLEQHDLGPPFTLNKYSVLSAERLTATEVSVEAIFQPGAPGEERERLVFRVRDGTRRTMFNQPEGGAVRVKDGIALARGKRTPLLRKCE